MVNQPVGTSGMYIAEVRDIKDPLYSGRVKVRLYGLNDNEQDVKDENLPWAMPIQDITSPATGKAGKAPVGLVVGSRVIVTYLSSDVAKQQPLIIGSFARGAEPTNTTDNTGGKEDLKVGSEGVDLPAQAVPTTKDGKNQADKAPNSLFNAPLNTEKDRYNEATVVSNASGPDGIKTSREQNAPNADKPTTAVAPPSKDLPSLLNQIDPNGLSQIMGLLFAAFASVDSTMSTSNFSSRKVIITDALSGALAILVKRLGFGLVVTAMNRCLNNNGIDRVTPIYKEIVQNAFAKLIQDAITYGANGIPVSVDPTIVKTTIIPNPLVNPGSVPDLSVQQYYTSENDPYPGYIQWLLPEGTLSLVGTNYVYTVRDKTTPPYASASEEIYAISEREMANTLEPYVKSLTLTVDILNTILATQDQNVYYNGADRTTGKNSGRNTMNLIAALLGILSILINSSKSQHIPNSVLNQGEVGTALEQFSQAMSTILYMKNMTSSAFGLSAASGIPGLNSLQLLQGGRSNLALATAIVGATPAIINSTANLISAITR